MGKDASDAFKLTQGLINLRSTPHLFLLFLICCNISCLKVVFLLSDFMMVLTLTSFTIMTASLIWFMQVNHSYRQVGRQYQQFEMMSQHRMIFADQPQTQGVYPQCRQEKAAQGFCACLPVCKSAASCGFYRQHRLWQIHSHSNYLPFTVNFLCSVSFLSFLLPHD